MSKGNGSNSCDCVYCHERVSTRGICLDAFWFSANGERNCTIHHERDVHVVVRGGKVVTIKEQPAYSSGRFLALACRDCTQGVPTQTFSFKPFSGMTKDAGIAAMCRAIQSAIEGAKEQNKVAEAPVRKRAKKAIAAA